MKCNHCGTYNEDLNSNFCANCGADLKRISENEEKTNSNSDNLNIINDIKDDSNTFLIIGIVMAMCCSLPFGAGVIIINELMYKKLLKEKDTDGIKKTKTLMIVLICVGMGSFLILQFFNIVLNVLEVVL